MKRKRQILTAVILSGSVGFGANSLFAQGAPGSGQPGPTVPQPRQTQPTIPGQTAPGVPGQTDPMPGQPGTVPERVQRPEAGDQGMAGVTADDIKKAKEALKAKGLTPGPIDGILDGKTQQALRDFQKANKLPVTGALDQQTAEKLGVTLGGERGSSPQRGKDSSIPRGSDMPKGKSSPE
jgi:Putative peptidoglycan binding domain